MYWIKLIKHKTNKKRLNINISKVNHKHKVSDIIHDLLLDNKEQVLLTQMMIKLFSITLKTVIVAKNLKALMNKLLVKKRILDSIELIMILTKPKGSKIIIQLQFLLCTKRDIKIFLGISKCHILQKHCFLTLYQ